VTSAGFHIRQLVCKR